MANDERTRHLSAAEAGRLIAARKLSPVELLEAFLQQIERVDHQLRSYLLVDAEGARAMSDFSQW